MLLQSSISCRTYKRIQIEITVFFSFSSSYQTPSPQQQHDVSLPVDISSAFTALTATFPPNRLFLFYLTRPVVALSYITHVLFRCRPSSVRIYFSILCFKKKKSLSVTFVLLPFRNGNGGVSFDLSGCTYKYTHIDITDFRNFITSHAPTNAFRVVLHRTRIERTRETVPE